MSASPFEGGGSVRTDTGHGGGEIMQFLITLTQTLSPSSTKTLADYRKGEGETELSVIPAKI